MSKSSRAQRSDLGAAAFLTALLLASCLPATEPCTATVSVLGTWRYSAVQQAPVHTTLSGTLSVTKQSCADFTGQLDLIEVTPQGGTRRIAGPLSGKLIDATSVRFDAFLEALPRQHLGSLSGDALEGTWLVLDGSGQSLSGTFGGQREK
jgi:hypothetical protein